MRTVKLFVYLMLAAAAYLVSCSGSKNEFTINGKITGDLKDSVYLYYENDSGKMVRLGEAIDKNGKFSLTGKVVNPTMATLVLRSKDDDQYGMGNHAGFILEPGKITVDGKTGEFENAIITAGPNQQEYNDLMALKKPLYDEMRKVWDAAGKESDPEKADSIKSLNDPIIEKVKTIDLAFIEEHPTSITTAYNLRMYVSSLDCDKLSYYFERLSPELKESKMGQELLKEINNLKAGSPGAVAADFTANDINGSSFSLSDFKGKYVIIDFWASWCVPCRKSFPHMIGLYNQYRDKGLEIICIADDDRNPEAWKAAIEKDNTGMWHHALRGFDVDKRMKNEENPNDISDKFGIHSLPTKILIDPQGMIIGRYVGEGDTEDTSSIDAKLKEIFG